MTKIVQFGTLNRGYGYAHTGKGAEHPNIIYLEFLHS